MKRNNLHNLCIVVLLFVLTTSMYSLPIQAAPTTDAVVGTGTPGSCDEANFDTALATVQGSGGGTITFNCGGAVTIPFSSEKLITVQDVVLAGAGEITLSGNDVTRLFHIQTNGHLGLQEIIITNGYSGADYGGAIYVASNGELRAENATIKDSATDGWAGGAIIDFNGTVTLVDSVIENNQSSYGALNSTGTLTLIRTKVLTNTATIAGGALSVGGQVTIEDSTIRGNSAPVGGALFITSSGHGMITGSTLTQNEANGTIIPETGGGAILNDGWLSVTNSTFSENVSSGSGGAIQNGYQVDNAYVFLNGVSLFENQSVLYGGALYNQGGDATAVNSTISDNIAQESGGGISSYLGPTTLIYATLSYNQGGNLNQIGEAGNQDSRQQIKLGKTALVGSSPNCLLTGTPAPDPLPYFNSQDHNLSDDTSCATYLTGTVDQNNIDAQLGPLTTNGGSTWTQMPLGESPLIDAAACSPDFLTDQRGFTRPQPDLCDIGAVEVASTPLAQILPRYYRLALDHLESVRGGPMAPNWSEARLSLRATPFYRPDLVQPAYYEFQVEVPGLHGYEPAGFIMVSTDPHDFPIPHWSEKAEAPSQMLLRKAGEQGNLIPTKYFRLDALAYAAEDSMGGLASMSDSTFNKIVRPPGPLPTVELSRLAWEPETTPPDDDTPANITYNLVSEGPISSTIQLNGWSSWAEIKSEYANTYEPYLNHLQDEAAEAWEVANGPIALQPGDSYTLPLMDTTADVQLSGEGAAWVTMTETQLPGDRRGVTLLVTQGPEAGSVPFQVNISTPAEQVHFVILPLQKTIYLPLMVQGGTGLNSYTPAVIQAPTTVTGWGDWFYAWAGTTLQQRRYFQIKPHTAQNNTSCPSGCGATAWGMLFGWADHQSWIGNPMWIRRGGIYRVNGGPGPQTPNADAPIVMAYPGVFNMIWEIRGYLGTWCVFGAGPTLPWRMADAHWYLYGRSYAWIDTRYNSVGWSEDRLMNGAADSIIFNHTPAIIGTGWLNHYPLAWGYASRTYHYGLGFTHTVRYFYVNQGWGGESEWVSASTWFAGYLIP